MARKHHNIDHNINIARSRNKNEGAWSRWNRKRLNKRFPHQTVKERCNVPGLGSRTHQYIKVKVIQDAIGKEHEKVMRGRGQVREGSKISGVFWNPVSR